MGYIDIKKIEFVMSLLEKKELGQLFQTENINTLNVYVPLTRTSKYTKKNQSEVNGETEKSTTNSWRFQYAT